MTKFGKTSGALALLGGVALLALTSCGDDGGSGSAPVPAPTPAPSPTVSPTPTANPTHPEGPPITATSQVIATLNAPWAMTFLPDGRMLVTEKAGVLRIVTQTGTVSGPVSGVPAVSFAGQGGLQDVALAPSYASNGLVYLTFAEAGTGGKGLALARGRLVLDGNGGGALQDVAVIWRQDPKVSGDGQFGGRIAFSPDGYLFLTAGERQKETPAQDLGGTLGKIVRLNLDGTVPAGNPFATRTGAKPEIWTLGHRNPYGLAFDATGRLWETEMGPSGGDEINLVTAGQNYGWPNVSNGSNYDGSPIPDHTPGDGFAAPALSWSPVIAPGGMIFYSGTMFADWRGDAIIAGLVSQGLVRVRISGTTAVEMQRIPLGNRIREVEQGPDGAIWVLEDAPTGRLLRLMPS